MFQHRTSSLSAALPEMDIRPTLPGGAQVDVLEPSGLITCLPDTGVILWSIHFTYKIVLGWGQSLQPQRLRVSDYMNFPSVFWHLRCLTSADTGSSKYTSCNLSTKSLRCAKLQSEHHHQYTNTLSLHCALGLVVQCIVIGPVCLCVGLFACGSVTTITRICVHRSSPNWVCRWRYWPSPAD